MSIPSKTSRGITGAVEHLFPGYFALVMATGIVSIAAALLAMPRLAVGLLVVNVACYAVLSTMLVVRLFRYFGRVLDDLRNHARGPGFFTVAAATCVLGSQFVTVSENIAVARGLWCAGIALWVVEGGRIR